MAFDTIASGEYMESANVQQIIDALTGVSGGGQQLQFNQLNDASNYALTIKNLDTSNGYALKVTDAADAVLLQLYKDNLQLGADPASDVLAINCNISGKVYIGDSANANMTIGVTINQAGNDNEILAFKSSDLSPGHGMTTAAETDTFGTVTKHHATNGGLRLDGYGAGSAGVAIQGNAVSDNTTKSTAGLGYIYLQAAKKSGTTVGDAGAGANLVVIKNNDTARFIFDAEGDFHADAGGGAGTAGVITGAAPNEQIAGYNTYDAFADVELVRALEVARNGRGLIAHEFDQFLRYNRDDLERLKLASFNDESVFVNYTGLVRLHSGAIWQLWTELREGLTRLELAESKLAALPQGTL